MWHRKQIEKLEARCCLSAITFLPHEVAVNEAIEAIAADLDGDGDADVISTYPRDSEIAWHENINGAGQFGQRKIIAPAGESISAVDLDHDGDLDILMRPVDDPQSASSDSVVWCENVDGAGTFDNQHVLAVSDARFVSAVDMDGDDDLDLLVDARQHTSWYENIDGRGKFGESRVTIASYYTRPGRSPVNHSSTADVDGDGAVDVISFSTTGFNRIDIFWHKNIGGTGEFREPQLMGTYEIHGFGGLSFAMADLDADGDQDGILGETAAFGEGGIVWFENLDAAGAFADQAMLDDNRTSAVAVADLDRDGDMDVLTVRFENPSTGWYENTSGVARLGQWQFIGTGFTATTRGVDIADLDGDGYLDILISDIWYENRLIGDINNDDIFDSTDLISALAAGKYEVSFHNNTPFEEGDWNQDGRFDSEDLIYALAAGHYQAE